VLVAERGLAATRQRAQSLIMAGHILVNDQPVDKPGTFVAADARVISRAADLAYVSRGGLKLEHALDFFGIKVNGFLCLDAGASTGGFTDCLLQRGACRVYAV
jgi:23S rRNA (cytidine1920-2'-O)/16S rRNA (cytidine1409-2'-O)-methyltransferase